MEITPRNSAQIQRISSPAPVGTGYEPQGDRSRELERDQFDFYRNSDTPRAIFQVIDQRIEEVGGYEVLTKVVQEQLELDGQPIETRTHTVTENLRELPRQAEDAQANLNIERVRALLADE